MTKVLLRLIVLLSRGRPAYRRDLGLLETPQALSTIGSQILRNAVAVTRDQALDLAVLMARTNNIVGLWNSFAVLGFVRLRWAGPPWYQAT